MSTAIALNNVINFKDLLFALV